jgi:hypothetical protein
VHRHSGWLVDNNHVVIFVENLDRFCRHRRFVSMDGVRHQIAILEHIMLSNCLAIHRNQTGIDSVFIVGQGSVSEFALEDVEELSAAPSLLAPGFVCVMIWSDPSQPVFEVVRLWPRLSGCYGGFCCRSMVCWLFVLCRRRTRIRLAKGRSASHSIQAHTEKMSRKRLQNGADRWVAYLAKIMAEGTNHGGRWRCRLGTERRGLAVQSTHLNILAVAEGRNINHGPGCTGQR